MSEKAYYHYWGSEYLMVTNNTIYELHYDGWEADPRYWIHCSFPTFYKEVIGPSTRRLSDVEVAMLGIDLLDMRDEND